MPHLHVALVTERPEKCLIPILQLRPQRIVLVPCRASAQAAERVAILLRHEMPTDTEIETRASLAIDDPRQCAAYANSLADYLQRQQFDNSSLLVTLDVSGCSTLTALLLQHAMRRCAPDWLYVDTQVGALYRMAGDVADCEPEVLAMEPVLDIDRYLQANGYKRVRALSDGGSWQAACQRRRSLTQYLAHHADRLAGLLGELHGMVHGEGGALATPDPHNGPELRPGADRQQLHATPRFPATDALTALSEAGMLEWKSDTPRQLSLTSPQGAFYVGGGWLTEYTWLSAREAGLSQLSAAAHLLDLRGQHNADPVVTDCLAVERNQLLFVESLIARPGAEACIEQGLKRLHGMLNHSAGLSATRVLLACGEFDKSRRRLTELQRLQGLRVEVVETAELRRLPTLLAKWKEQGKWPDSPGL
ncbi:Card1-like endonuclease domain-containing protein [Billgrantia kenyensis]|uniref:DUF1887 family protein n=1 Tax=Billgrantia kenyensis TaxID=321266 RepID=A0A7V9W202_9GAMM|nr:DUF1887 family CARF protein [Halomonas kenyensis]MBA2779595.1 DUF1887 family protein [Halomonas kenyensis]MCG6662307.1 DUF1887 family protein [Halomonas kenyensis]